MNCDRKIKYLTQATAELAIDRAKAYHVKGEQKDDMQFMNSYKCEACSFWHIGKSRWHVSPAPATSRRLDGASNP